MTMNKKYSHHWYLHFLLIILLINYVSSYDMTPCFPWMQKNGYHTKQFPWTIVRIASRNWTRVSCNQTSINHNTLRLTQGYFKSLSHVTNLKPILTWHTQLLLSLLIFSETFDWMIENKLAAWSCIQNQMPSKFKVTFQKITKKSHPSLL